MSLPNGEAWRRGRVLAVGEARFAVEYNPPTVDKVRGKREEGGVFPLQRVQGCS